MRIGHMLATGLSLLVIGVAHEMIFSFKVFLLISIINLNVIIMFFY